MEEAVCGRERTGAGALTGADADAKDLEEDVPDAAAVAEAGLPLTLAGAAPDTELVLEAEGFTSVSRLSTETSEPCLECIILMNSCSI